MRLTRALFGYHRQRGIHPGRIRKIKWKEGSPIVVPKEITFADPRLQLHVERSGKPVENLFWNPPWEKPKVHPPWTPERDDPRFKVFEPKPPIESHPLWKERSAYVYHETTKLQCRMEQAQLLAKCVLIEGLPPRVENLLGVFRLRDQNELLRRLVLQAVAWDQTNEELPKWYPPPDKNDPYKFVSRWDVTRRSEFPRGVPYQRQSDTLLANFLHLCAIYNHERDAERKDAPPLTDSLKKRHLIRDSGVRVTCEHLDGDLLHLVGQLHSVIYADSPLPAVANDDAVRLTVEEKLPELWPLKPNIDLLPKHIYDDADLLTFSREKSPVLSQPIHPHTVALSLGDWWDIEDHAPRALMFTFAAAHAQARLRFGVDVTGVLPEPVVLQGVATNGYNFTLVTFQLNTVDLASPDGVKNLAWVDAGCQNSVREDWRPTTLTKYKSTQKPYILKEFNPRAFEKILAMYLNGGVADH